ncbi:MAG: DUF4926 domain-containing protein [Zoogloeaceae bacterium]|jgi:hypothetical protein|nr:DUF4926 domain-containing protein [Zoogloeaceae bacterium]
MKLLDTVAMLEDIPKEGLVRGQVGVVVEELAQDVVLVEFSGLDGATYAITPVTTDKVMSLKYESVLMV